MVKMYSLCAKNSFIFADFIYNGRYYRSAVRSQDDVYYVVTGSKMGCDLIRHDLSETQSAAVAAFIASNEDIKCFDGMM